MVRNVINKCSDARLRLVTFTFTATQHRQEKGSLRANQRTRVDHNHSVVLANDGRLDFVVAYLAGRRRLVLPRCCVGVPRSRGSLVRVVGERVLKGLHVRCPLARRPRVRVKIKPCARTPFGSI